MKWGKNHACPLQVALHINEEMLSVLHIFDGQFLEDISTSDEGAGILAVQDRNVHVKQKSKKCTIRLLGMSGTQQLSIFVDSGSAATFLNTMSVHKLKLSPTAIPISHYNSADGGLTKCDSMIQGLQWWCQGTSFCQDTKVIYLEQL